MRLDLILCKGFHHITNSQSNYTVESGVGVKNVKIILYGGSLQAIVHVRSGIVYGIEKYMMSIFRSCRWNI